MNNVNDRSDGEYPYKKIDDKQKTLSEIRDEIADKYGEETKQYPKLYPRDDFYAGFDAGIEEMKKRAQGLVIELECALKYLEPTYKNSEKHEPEVCMIECFKKALEAYKKGTE